MITSTARQAERELEEAGVPSTDIQIDSNRKTAGAGSAQYQDTDRHESGFKEWWDSLFGSNDNDNDRSDYEGAISRGSTVLRVTVAAEAVDTAVDILNRNGATDVGKSGSTATTATNEESTTRSNRAETSGKGPVEVVEEELQIGKRAVQRGGVRIYSHVVSQPVEQEVRLREEHVNVERRKVDREISPDEVNALRDQTIEVTEMAEEAVIGKRARVVKRLWWAKKRQNVRKRFATMFAIRKWKWSSSGRTRRRAARRTIRTNTGAITASATVPRRTSPRCSLLMSTAIGRRRIRGIGAGRGTRWNRTCAQITSARIRIASGNR